MNQAGIVKLLREVGVLDLASISVRGKYLTHTCPFACVTHSNGTDRNPSMSILIEENGYSYFKCWSCKITGKLYTIKNKLSQLLENVDDYESIKHLREFENKAIDELPYMPPVHINQLAERPKPLDPGIYENIFMEISDDDQALHYLSNRGISLKTAERLGLRFDALEQRIVFPVYGRDDNLYGFTGRTIIENWKERHMQGGKPYPKVKDYAGLQKRFFLLNETRMDNCKPTLVVEGLFALAHLVELGLEECLNVVAVLGSNLTPPKVNTLVNTGNAVYLLFDNDKAGRQGIFGIQNEKGTVVTQGALQMLYGKVPVLVPEYPKNKKDPDELTRDDLDFMLEMTYNYIINN